jgi:carboxyl-terminal processing protease
VTRGRAAVLVLVLSFGALPALAQPAAQASGTTARPASSSGWRARGIAAFDTVWRTINETHFDPSFGGLDWGAVGRELRDRVEAATSPAEQRGIIADLLSRLEQSHFALLTGSGSEVVWRGPAEPPIDVRVKSGSLIVTRVRDARAGLRPGDGIRSIDGVALSAVLAGDGQDAPVDELLAWRRASAALSGNAGTTVHLEVAGPDGTIRDVNLVRRLPPGEIVRLGNLPPIRAFLETESRRTAGGRTVGIIRFNVWMASLADSFADAIDAFRSADGLVIDLRGNPGGLAEMMRGIAGHLIDEPALLGRMRMRDLTLEFRVNPRRSTRDGRSVQPYAGPVAILVDELTASTSECFAGGLQALGRARIFGRRTAGQALPASTTRLENGDVLLYAVGDFVTGAGQRIEGVGVLPDEDVPLDPLRLAAGFDAETAAMVWMDQRSTK